MTIEEINSAEYAKIFPEPYIPFNSVAFNVLNSHKCDKLVFFLFQDSNKKLGLIGGIKDSGFLSPFSAPFSSFSSPDNNIKLNYILEAMLILEEHLYKQNLNHIKFVLPPYFYNEHFISKLIFCFNSNNYLVKAELGHYFDIKDYTKFYENIIDKDLRYKIRTAVKNNLLLVKANTIDEYRLAYEILLINKKSKSRSVSLDFNNLLEMTKLVGVDFFIVFYKDNAVASAIIYNNTPKISQIIHWGDLPDFSKYYPMNFLAWNVFRFYYEKKYDIIDLGTSMSECEPNYGLCNFKESIGCTTSMKFTFSKNLINS
jgi:hypothetical protein